MSMDYKDFYRDVYDNDNPRGEAFGWIQWKGTDACIDLHCKCGYHGHMDAEFLYFYECPECHAKYALGQRVKLIPLTEEQARHVTEEHVGFKTDDERCAVQNAGVSASNGQAGKVDKEDE